MQGIAIAPSNNAREDLSSKFWTPCNFSHIGSPYLPAVILIATSTGAALFGNAKHAWLRESDSFDSTTPATCRCQFTGDPEMNLAKPLVTIGFTLAAWLGNVTMSSGQELLQASCFVDFARELAGRNEGPGGC